MRVLTIRQPWAGAFFVHGKDVENRSWPTQHRGPLIIHSSANTSVDDDDGLLLKWPDSNAWECGALLGYVEVVDCVRNSKSRWAVPGSWHWLVKDAALFKKPIPMKGRLNLWSIDDLATLRRIKNVL